MSLKKALATLLATVMMLSLVSCGSKSNEEAPDDASKPTESAESSGKIKVGFSSAAFSDEWCHNLALAFENLTATEGCHRGWCGLHGSHRSGWQY